MIDPASIQQQQHVPPPVCQVLPSFRVLVFPRPGEKPRAKRRRDKTGQQKTENSPEKLGDTGGGAAASSSASSHFDHIFAARGLPLFCLHREDFGSPYCIATTSYSSSVLAALAVHVHYSIAPPRDGPRLYEAEQRAAKGPRCVQGHAGVCS